MAALGCSGLVVETPLRRVLMGRPLLDDHTELRRFLLQPEYENRRQRRVREFWLSAVFKERLRESLLPSATQEREDVAPGTNARYRSLLVREEGAGPPR